MIISNELLDIIKLGYCGGGCPTLTRQLAIGQGFEAEYRAFRKQIWRDWNKIVSLFYELLFFSRNAYIYIERAEATPENELSMLFDSIYDQRSYWLPHLIWSFCINKPITFEIVLIRDYIPYSEKLILLGSDLSLLKIRIKKVIYQNPNS